ncbi:MAG: ABC transporter permease [Clostridia bacterium]|nr:ABC transporter permease [Clostridia bacterium]
MYRYFLKRILLIIPTMLGVILLVFSIMSITPGDPGRQILGSSAPQSAVDALNHEFGIDRPFLVRLGDYMWGVITRLDFGESWRTRQSVFVEITARFPTTLKLSMMAIIGEVLIGVPLGILAAVKQYSVTDFVSTVFAMMLGAVPGFWLGLMLMLLFGVILGVLPTAGLTTPAHFILPLLTMILPGASGLLKITRSTMLECIRADYVRTARAKGAEEKSVILNHALRNALLPIVTVCGINFAHMLGGSVVIENVFSIPGIGSILVNSINLKDIPQVMAITIMFSFTFCLVMVLVDIVYSMLDPRVKAQYQAAGKRAKKTVKGKVAA